MFQFQLPHTCPSSCLLCSGNCTVIVLAVYRLQNPLTLDSVSTSSKSSWSPGSGHLRISQATSARNRAFTSGLLWTSCFLSLHQTNVSVLERSLQVSQEPKPSVTSLGLAQGLVKCLQGTSSSHTWTPVRNASSRPQPRTTESEP